ncbi:diacylglycerol/polyprenol kinase family protein [Candidatus Neomarinimicrobiota bacterium]
MRLLPFVQERGRKVVHLVSSIIPLGYWAVGPELGKPLLVLLVLAMALFELARMYLPRGRILYKKFFGYVTRQHEYDRPSGALYVFVGYLLAALLFTPAIAILTMLFTSIGDTAAALIGQRYGKIRIGSKTLEGTLACFFVCLLLTIPSNLTLLASLTGAFTAAIAELIRWPFINDNLAIPVLSGAAITLVIAAGL